MLGHVIDGFGGAAAVNAADEVPLFVGELAQEGGEPFGVAAVAVHHQNFLEAVTAGLLTQLLKEEHFGLHGQGDGTGGHGGPGLGHVTENKIGKNAHRLQLRGAVGSLGSLKAVRAKGQVQAVLFYASHGDDAYALRLLDEGGEGLACVIEPTCFHDNILRVIAVLRA